MTAAITYPLTGEGAYDAAAFPSNHRYPGGLPPFLRNGHNFAHVGVAEDIAFERGEDRSREMYTFNPQMVTVSTELNQAEFDTFSAWYEDELKAGTCRFDVQVAEQGGIGLAWWAAQFVGTYRWNYLSGDYYEVSAELLLLDGPYATRTAPTLRGTMSLATRLVAAMVVDTVLRGSMRLTTTLQARPATPTLRGAAILTTTLQGYLGEPVLADEQLSRVWMGLDYTLGSVASSDDALTAQWMGL